MFFESVNCVRFLIILIKSLHIMLKKLPKQPQLEMFKTVLTSFRNPEHELCHLARKIDWAYLESEFAPIKHCIKLSLLH
jgi:hypothetical protein